MIVGTLATYPARLSTLRYVVKLMVSRVDRLNVVLNRGHDIPAFLAGFPGVVSVIPQEEMRDAGTRTYLAYRDRNTRAAHTACSGHLPRKDMTWSS